MSRWPPHGTVSSVRIRLPIGGADRGLAGYNVRLLTAAGLDPADIVLDVGCGNGQFTCDATRVAREGTAHGLDLSSSMLSRARERWPIRIGPGRSCTAIAGPGCAAACARRPRASISLMEKVMGDDDLGQCRPHGQTTGHSLLN